MGARLILRSGRTVRPTEAGAAMLARCQHYLDVVRDLKSVMNNGVLQGELRLGAVQTALTGIVPDILSLLNKSHPQIEIHISRDTSAELYRRVLSGNLDAAVTSPPSFAIPKTCDWRTLREEPFVVLTPSSMRGTEPHKILAREPFIRLDRRVHAGGLIDSYLRRARIRPNELFELDGVEAIAVMVDRGLGVSILPDWAPPWPEGLSLRKIRLPDRSFTRLTGLIWMRASLRGRLIQAFLQQAQLALSPDSGFGKRKKGSPRSRF